MKSQRLKLAKLAKAIKELNKNQPYYSRPTLKQIRAVVDNHFGVSIETPNPPPGERGE